MIRFIAASAAASLLVGCNTSPHAVTPATAGQRSLLLEKVKSLAGTWESTRPIEHGPGPGIVVFSVTSNGSAVREIMFPGNTDEMTNMYTMDGPTLVMTHYCSMGNQPRMRATAGAPDRIELESDGVSNLTANDQEYMGALTIVFKDANTIEERWTSYKAGKPEEPHVFELKRRKP